MLYREMLRVKPAPNPRLVKIYVCMYVGMPDPKTKIPVTYSSASINIYTGNTLTLKKKKIFLSKNYQMFGTLALSWARRLVSRTIQRQLAESRW